MKYKAFIYLFLITLKKHNPKPIIGIKQYEHNVFFRVHIVLLWRREQDLSRRSRVSGESAANGALHYFKLPFSEL